MKKETEVVIEIDADGTVYIDGINFEGKGCHEAIEAYRRHLGKITKQTKKSEFYKKKVTVGQKNVIGS